MQASHHCLAAIYRTRRPRHYYLSLPDSWEALPVSQYTKLVLGLNSTERCDIPRRRSPPTTLSHEPIRGVSRVTRRFAPAQLLGLVGIAEPGPGEDAGDAAGEGDGAGAAFHVDAVNITHTGVAISRLLEAFLSLTVQGLPTNKDFISNVAILDSFHCLMQFFICIIVEFMLLNKLSFHSKIPVVRKLLSVSPATSILIIHPNRRI